MKTEPKFKVGDIITPEEPVNPKDIGKLARVIKINPSSNTSLGDFELILKFLDGKRRAYYWTEDKWRLATKLEKVLS